MMRTLGTLTLVELKLFIREPFSMIFTVAFPVVLLVVLVGSFQAGDPAFGGHDPADYYLATYVGVVIGAIGLITAPVHLATYRELGILRRFQVSGLTNPVVIGSHLLTGLVMAIIGSVVLVIAAVALYGAALPRSLGPVAAAFVVATICLQCIGLLLGSIVNSARAAQAVGMLLFFPMWLLCGAGPPPDVMGDGMRQLSEVLPLTFAVRSIGQPWLNGGTSLLDLAVLTTILVLTAAMAGRALRSRQ